MYDSPTLLRTFADCWVGRVPGPRHQSITLSRWRSTPPWTSIGDPDTQNSPNGSTPKPIPRYWNRCGAAAEKDNAISFQGLGSPIVLLDVGKREIDWPKDGRKELPCCTTGCSCALGCCVECRIWRLDRATAPLSSRHVENRAGGPAIRQPYRANNLDFPTSPNAASSPPSALARPTAGPERYWKSSAFHGEAVTSIPYLRTRRRSSTPYSTPHYVHFASNAGTAAFLHDGLGQGKRTINPEQILATMPKRPRRWGRLYLYFVGADSCRGKPGPSARWRLAASQS